jgi:hypothetical protein
MKKQILALAILGLGPQGTSGCDEKDQIKAEEKKAPAAETARATAPPAEAKPIEPGAAPHVVEAAPAPTVPAKAADAPVAPPPATPTAK